MDEAINILTKIGINRDLALDMIVRDIPVTSRARQGVHIINIAKKIRREIKNGKKII